MAITIGPIGGGGLTPDQQATLDDHAAALVVMDGYAGADLEAKCETADGIITDADSALTGAGYSALPDGVTEVLADLPTAYATVAAMRAAVASLSDGHVAKLTGVSGLCCEVSSGALVKDPLLIGTSIPALKVGKGATNGYSDAQGTSSEDANGITLAQTPASPAPDDAHGIRDLGGANFYDHCVKITLPLPALVTGETVVLKGRIRLQGVDVNASNTLACVLGLYLTSDPDTGIYARTGAFTTPYCSIITVSNGTPTSGSLENLKNLAAGTVYSDDEFTFTLVSANWGRDISSVVDVDDETDMATSTASLADGHPWVTAMQGASPSVALMMGVFAQDNGDPGSMTATLLELSVWNPS